AESFRRVGAAGLLVAPNSWRSHCYDEEMCRRSRSPQRYWTSVNRSVFAMRSQPRQLSCPVSGAQRRRASVWLTDAPCLAPSCTQTVSSRPEGGQLQLPKGPDVSVASVDL